MPGSIRVSVLEAFDLSDIVSDGKDVAIKVSIGKIEYKTESSKAIGGKTVPWNSNFEFPVLNLRDNLSVMLIGDDEEAISKNEIDTPSIVEQGSFAVDLVLKGGGKIHLRLSFVLTDEERRRIDMMRAAALKRKEQAALKASGAVPPPGLSHINSDGVQDSVMKDMKNDPHHSEGSGPQATNPGQSTNKELDVLEKSLDRSVEERRKGSLASEEQDILENSLNPSVEERGEEQSEESTHQSTGSRHPAESDTSLTQSVQAAFDQGSVGNGLLSVEGKKEESEGSTKESPDAVDGEDGTLSSVKAKIKAFEKTRPKGGNVQPAFGSGKVQMSSPTGKVSSKNADNEAHEISDDAELPIKEREYSREVTSRGKEHGQSVFEGEKSLLAPLQKPLVSSVSPKNVNDIGILDGDIRAVTERQKDVECNATSMKEMKKANLFGISQQVLGGVALVAAGVLLWAAHSNKRSSYRKRSKQRKRK